MDLDEQLLEYNRQGLIPGPEESEAEFIKRAEYCLQIKHEMYATFPERAPFASEEVAPHGSLEKALAVTQNLFDIKPDWIPLFFSNHELAPWHGGCAWIFQITEESPTTALLQLRKAFHRQESYLGLYNRDELISHELTHVGRMMFQEPKFEEILAYQTSQSRFRRWFGPILQSSNETLLFAGILFIIIFLDLALIVANQFELYHRLMWLKLLPVTLVLYAIARLWWRYRQLERCQRQLTILLDDEKRASAVVYRLTDQEIIDFSGMTSEQIQQFVLENKDRTPRWCILQRYFSKQDK